MTQPVISNVEIVVSNNEIGIIVVIFSLMLKCWPVTGSIRFRLIFNNGPVKPIISPGLMKLSGINTKTPKMLLFISILQIFENAIEGNCILVNKLLK